VRVLAIETTETTGSVAAACDDNLLLELKLSQEIRSAQSLAPGLKAILERVGWRPIDVELVAVAVGPGSFTGLRVGVTTAKTLAYCVGARILGVDTLEVIAAAAPAEVPRLWAAVDAQRGQVVAQLFERGPEGHFLAAGPAELLDVDLWLARLAPATCLSGPVLRKLASRVSSHLTVLDPQCWSPSAAAVAELALRRYRAGQRDDVWSLVPRYSRRSAAEEKWNAAPAPGKPGG
jgi:tRNA threonylcarbamoyladenosine biosynthesis protein TsaB